jgi:hypothetical protein
MNYNALLSDSETRIVLDMRMKVEDRKNDDGEMYKNTIMKEQGKREE